MVAPRLGFGSVSVLFFFRVAILQFPDRLRETEVLIFMRAIDFFLQPDPIAFAAVVFFCYRNILNC